MRTYSFRSGFKAPLKPCFKVYSDGYHKEIAICDDQSDARIITSALNFHAQHRNKEK